jgi:hypothetical protein
MDDALFQRFQAGDPQARTAMRNQLRSVAARVLHAPQWRMTNVQQVRRLEQEVALAALEVEGDSAVAYAAAAMELASIRCIDHVRHRDGHPASNLTADLLARVAMETASSRDMDQANELLAESKVNTRLLDTVRSALRTAAKAQAALPTREPPTQPPPPKKPKRPARARSAARKAQPRRRLPPKKSQSGGLKALAPFVIIALVFGGLGYQRWAPKPEPIEVTIAWLLPHERPPTARADELSGLAREAALTLRKGRCDQAADRLHMEFRKDSENMWVRYYEGLAFICARKGLSALEALKDVEAQMAEPPFGMAWWLAQAQLLSGDLATGLGTLDALSGTDHPRALQSATLARVIRDELN